MHSRFLFTTLLLGLMALSASAFAQSSVTYCNTYDGSFADFELAIPVYDVVANPMLDATIVLNVTFDGEFTGENLDPDLVSYYVFGLNLDIETAHLTGEAITGEAHVELEGEIAPASIITEPYGGVFLTDVAINFEDPLIFYEPQVLTFTASGLGGAYNTGGDSNLSWSTDLLAEVCATYTYDEGVGSDEISFGALKATYR